MRIGGRGSLLGIAAALGHPRGRRCMPKPRQKKDNHLLYADAVASRGKSGVWFGERESFRSKQLDVMESLKERIDWVPLENAVMAVSLDPPGIAIIAPNPSLPGIIVLADGATTSNTEQIKRQFIETVRKVLDDADIAAEA